MGFILAFREILDHESMSMTAVDVLELVRRCAAAAKEQR